MGVCIICHIDHGNSSLELLRIAMLLSPICHKKTLVIAYDLGVTYA